MAGGMLVVLGVTGMGSAVRFIPRPVVVGFTNGIAVLIASTQIRDFLGLQLETVPAISSAAAPVRRAWVPPGRRRPRRSPWRRSRHPGCGPVVEADSRQHRRAGLGTVAVARSELRRRNDRHEFGGIPARTARFACPPSVWSWPARCWYRP